MAEADRDRAKQALKVFTPGACEAEEAGFQIGGQLYIDLDIEEEELDFLP